MNVVLTKEGITCRGEEKTGKELKTKTTYDPTDGLSPEESVDLLRDEWFNE